MIIIVLTTILIGVVAKLGRVHVLERVHGVCQVSV